MGKTLRPFLALYWLCRTSDNWRILNKFAYYPIQSSSGTAPMTDEGIFSENFHAKYNAKIRYDRALWPHLHELSNKWRNPQSLRQLRTFNRFFLRSLFDKICPQFFHCRDMPILVSMLIRTLIEPWSLVCLKLLLQ